MNILVLDIGTTSMRGILFGPGGRWKASQSVPTPPVCGQGPGWVEQRPQAYDQGILAICRAIAQAHRVDAVSVTGFRSAPTLVDREGRALCNFIMWQDTRCQPIIARLHDAGEQVFFTCGATLNTVFTGGKLAWLRENRPGLYRQAYKAMIVPDYALHLLTGGFSTDYTYGSRTLLMDIRRLQWDEDMCALFGVDMDKLCPLRPQGTVTGAISPAFARLSGIAPGVPVVSAGGDQQCGALGMGVMDGKTIQVNSGTGAFVIALSDRPCLEERRVITNVAAIPGLYTQELNVIASASALNWLMETWFPEYAGPPADYQALNRLAGQAPPGGNGLYLLPHFQGCGARDWNPGARAALWGLSLDTRRQDVVRALYEGIAAEIAKSIDVLPCARQCSAIAAAGGLSNSAVYNQIVSDMTGCRVERRRNVQATAMGAYISAAVALGQYSGYRQALKAVQPEADSIAYLPDPERVRFYQGYKARTEQLYRVLCSI